MTQKIEHLLFEKMSRFCNYRFRCSSEIEQKFKELDAQEPSKSIVLEWLKEGEYFNDKVYARSFATGKFRIKGWGKMKIRSALFSKRIPTDLIEDAIQNIELDEYLDNARKLILKKVASNKIDHQMRQKVIRSMFLKGYSSSLVLDILQGIETEKLTISK